MSRQRAWAVKAHQCVRARVKDSLVKKYNTHCKKGPSLLQRAGAAQGLAFLVSRKEAEGGKQYAADLAQIYGEPSAEALLNRAQGAEFDEYLVLSRDLLSISAWLRRFAQIELGEPEP